jgi:hypothetical protein
MNRVDNNTLPRQNQGRHLEKIYQASNWLFVGPTGHEARIMLNGKLTHRQTINSKIRHECRLAVELCRPMRLSL